MKDSMLMAVTIFTYLINIGEQSCGLVNVSDHDTEEENCVLQVRNRKIK